MKETKLIITETAEHVLPGHPDKLCDAIVDAIVDKMQVLDSGSQCGLEAAVIFNSLYLTGRIAGSDEALAALDVKEIAREMWREAGYGKDSAGYFWGPSAEQLEITTNFCLGDFDSGERELRHLSDDQAICVGYATDDATTNFMPPAHWAARKIAKRLFELRTLKGAGQIGPDGKVIVQIERTNNQWRPTVVSISLNHHEQSDWMVLREVAEQAVEESLIGMPMPEIKLNGAGSFIAGGPNGDNGLSGKKLVVDAYGPTIPIGGGAWSGKDFRKVDRLGGMLARELALKAIHKRIAKEAIVRLSYFPGSDRPALIEAVMDGKPLSSELFLEMLGNPDITNLTTWNRYKICKISLPELARWGHQQVGTPWED